MKVLFSLILTFLSIYVLGIPCPESQSLQTPVVTGGDTHQYIYQLDTCKPLSSVCTYDEDNTICVGKNNCCYVCQFWNGVVDPQASTCVASTEGTMVVEGGTVHITYTGGEKVPPAGKPRFVDVYISCGKADFTFISYADNAADQNPPSYNYTLKYSAASVCNSVGPGAGGGISGGSVFLILLFVGAFLYLVIGIIVNKFVRHQEGIEMIPNVEFWKESPFLAVGGVKFIISKITGREYQPLQ